MSGQGEEERFSKKEGYKYADSRITGKSARILIVDDPIGEHDGRVAQEVSARLWYALANALAEKAIADLDRGDA